MFDKNSAKGIILLTVNIKKNFEGVSLPPAPGSVNTKSTKTGPSKKKLLN